MRAYVYLDTDLNVVVKTASYIENENPKFWDDNWHFIMGMWKVDTENRDTIIAMLRRILDLGLPQSHFPAENIRILLIQLGLNPDDFFRQPGSR